MTEIVTTAIVDNNQSDEQTESTLRVIVERFPNPECTTFHVSERFHAEAVCVSACATRA